MEIGKVAGVIRTMRDVKREQSKTCVAPALLPVLFARDGRFSTGKKCLCQKSRVSSEKMKLHHHRSSASDDRCSDLPISRSYRMAPRPGVAFGARDSFSVSCG